MKRWCPDGYCNWIRFRVPRPESIRVNAPLEINFETWEQAHEWLLADRRSKVDQAEKELAARQRQLIAAHKMTKPEGA